MKGPERSDHFIEPDGSNHEQIRRLGYQFIDLLVDSASRAGVRPPLPPRDPGERAIPEPYVPPLSGRGAGELIEEVRERILDQVMNPGHPGYVGHMDSIASAIGIFSDAIVSSCNNNMLSYEMSLAFTHLERALLGWVARSIGWGEGSGGMLVSGGTLANIQAIWTARNARLGVSVANAGVATRRRPPVVIVSEDAHYSFRKAANLLGIGRDGLVTVPVPPGQRVSAAAIEETVERVRREGGEPFCVVGIAGTTITGSIEPLEEIGELARRHGLWFHVDAAYGGSLLLAEDLRQRLRGWEMADSITWNPQKWLYVPKACAAILYRDAGILEQTIREPFLYGREDGVADRPNLGEYTIQGTRRVDALKLWLTLEHLGTEALASLVRSHLDRARWLAGRIAETPGLRLVCEPDLSIVCFQQVPVGRDAGGSGEDLDRLQAEVQQGVARRGRGWLSMPRYRGRRVLRAVILHPRCDEEVLEGLLEDIVSVAAEIAAGLQAGSAKRARAASR